MNIECPTLERNEEATEEAIAELVPLLAEREDPYLILSETEMTYMQTLWTPEGYALEYQNESILEHYGAKGYFEADDIIWALQSYLQGQPYWKTKFEFERQEIATTSFKIGHFFGSIIGKFSSFLRGGKEF